MSEIKHREHLEHENSPVDKWKHFQDNYRKANPASALRIVLLVIVGYFGYKQFIQDPKEKQAAEAMFRAEDYFRMDSVRLALNGDAVNAGFVKIISRYQRHKSC